MVDFARVQKELQECNKDNDVSGISIKPKGDNLTAGTIPGPLATPYEGGTFNIDIILPDGCPFVPPRMQFATKVWTENGQRSYVEGQVDYIDYNDRERMSLLILVECAQMDVNVEEWDWEYNTTEWSIYEPSVDGDKHSSNSTSEPEYEVFVDSDYSLNEEPMAGVDQYASKPPENSHVQDFSEPESEE
ncbi:Ubiquitin-conjugating enzyme E2 27 [Camellia lanceoleosa]|uniref:Ubiquitin-conjugating enzyme E2 27 n=1 Tax=Camellia lanceoleosa TaxID=1840588 RepID=A0ACC0FLT9_9ERIC|nr:Ubiquitin-conjugating enzyme E2 27 [Camellia lanceoleosa]